MFLLNSCSFWKIRNKLKVEFIIPFMNTSGPLNQLFETGRILVGQVVFANTVLVLPLCLIEYVREDLLSNFLTETAERLIIWERGQKVIQDLFWEQFVLLIWPKSGVGEGGGSNLPPSLFLIGSAGPTSYIDRFNSRSFLIEDDYYTAYHKVSYPFNFIFCKDNLRHAHSYFHMKGLFCPV
jgi:hypothetical protein